MRNRLNSEEIYDQYIDATAALLMDRYAAAMQESMEAEKDEAEIPEELDRKCRKLIRKKLAGKRFRYVLRKLLRMTGAAAMIVVLLFGAVGILFTTVEAVRVPIINFFIEQKDGYLEIGGRGDAASASVAADENDPLAGLLPEGYEIVLYDVSASGNITALYENSRGDAILLDICPGQSVLQIDTEHASASETLQIGAWEAILVEKEGYQLAWLDSDSDLLYHLAATALTREEIIDLAKNIEKSR